MMLFNVDIYGNIGYNILVVINHIILRNTKHKEY